MGPLNSQQNLPIDPQKMEPAKAEKVEEATFPDINVMHKLVYSYLTPDERDDLIMPAGKDRIYQHIVDQTVKETLTPLSQIIDSLVKQLKPDAPQIKELLDIKEEIKEKRPDISFS